MSSMLVTAAVSGSEMIAMRAAELRIIRMFRDPELLRSVVEAGPQEFARIARTQLRGLGLTMADVDRLFQLLQSRLSSIHAPSS